MTHLLLIIIYLAFISLGLPDAALGSAWPSMYPEINVPVSYAGGLSMLIALVTTVSSLMSDRLTRRFGTGRVTAISAASTAAALLGFSVSGRFWQLCLWAVPYGLGAGCVDTCLNNYVAIHYKSQHMSWLHCMWGVGASLGPGIMGMALTGGFGWSGGYLRIALIQAVIAALLFLSLPMWRRQHTEEQQENTPLSMRKTAALPGVGAAMLCFFGYCALEQATGLWATSYLSLYKGVPADTAAAFGGMYFIGITIGRGISGFMSMKLKDGSMIRLGFLLMAAGIAAMLLPLGTGVSLGGFVLIGLGSAPVFPCMIHSTPAFFGTERSQAVIGLEMAGAYIGICVMPTLFGVLAEKISVALLPWFLLLMLALMGGAYFGLERKCGRQ